MECFQKTPINGAQKEVPGCSSQQSLHYICMPVQVGLAMNMNNKTVVSAAVSISSALRKNPADRPLECSCSRRCQAMPGRAGRTGRDGAELTEQVG